MRTQTSRSPPAACRLLAWSALVLVSNPDAQEPDSRWVDQSSLRAGEILLNFGEERRFQGLIRAAVLIEADPEDIWGILKDCESAPEYVPHVVSCELVETHDNGLTQVFRQVVKYAWFLPSFEHVFSLRYWPDERIEVQRVSGPIEHMQGIWQLLPAGGQATLLVYELELRPGLPVPGFMVGATLGRDVPIILAEVRKRAEAARQSAR